MISLLFASMVRSRVPCVGLVFDAKNLALALHVDIGSGRHVPQFVERAYVAGHVPHPPQRSGLRCPVAKVRMSGCQAICAARI